MAHPRKPHLDRVPRRWNPSIWASNIPFGIGEQHPNNFDEITRAMPEHKDEQERCTLPSRCARPSWFRARRELWAAGSPQPRTA